MRPVLFRLPVLVLVLAFAALVGCGEARGVDPTPHHEVTAAGAPVKLVGEAKADFVLHVSNQSFDDEEVQLRITIDGVTVVDGAFHVEGQHNWVSFPLDLTSGLHEISAESDSGATLRKSFEVPQGDKRYAVIGHWRDGGSADLTWQFHRQPVAFG